MYKISQISKMFNLPISTIRYYDKEGLFPKITRSSGIRQFNDNDLDMIRLIECMKKSGIKIKDIKQFIEWSLQGSSTYTLRRDFFVEKKEMLEEEIIKMQKSLDMLRFKCWYYEKAIQDGNEEKILKMLPDNLPKEIQYIYNNAHGINS